MRKYLEVVRLAVMHLFVDHAPQWAAAIAYYSLLSIFPLLLLAVMTATWLVPADQAVEWLSRVVSSFVPDAEATVRTTVMRVYEARHMGGVLPTIVLLVAGSRVFATLTLALNIIFHVDRQYTFWKGLAVNLLMMLTVGVLFVSSILSGFVLSHADVFFGLARGTGTTLLDALRFVVPLPLTFAAFLALYRWIPREHRDWTSSLVGAALACVGFWCARGLFMRYLDTIGHYNPVYGSFAVVITILVWAWLSAFVVLIGGEVAAMWSAVVVEGLTPQEVVQRHERHSAMRHRQKEKAFDRWTPLPGTV